MSGRSNSRDLDSLHEVLNSNLIVTILHKRLFMASFSDWMDGVRVAIAIPTIEVRFENMNIGAEVHVGSRALPIFTNYMVNKIEVWLLDQFTGKVTYNGHGMNEFSEKPWPSQHESKELGLLMVFRREKEANITPDPDIDVYMKVRFENLNVEAEVHVGTRASPTFFNFMFNIVEGLLNFLHILPSRKQHITIIRDVSGIIKPGRMTLLLGPPSSGKTTLLLALAAKLDPKLKFSGKVTYNGHEMNEFVPQRTAAYVNQNDHHVAELTVRETLAFSARVQGVGTHYDLLAELSRREKEANIRPDPDIDVYMKAVATEGQKANLITDYVLRILGLETCADTIIGNEMLRGISGGQKKRLTTGEMLVGPTKALFMDEISTGLDSSTTFQIVNSVKQCVHILKGTAVISLLQPTPETYNLFDDIILLSDSHIVYQGPREHVLEFFKSMGFKCPERKGVADFLQEVTSRKDQEQYWADKDQPYRFVTSKEFSEAHRSFHVGRSLVEELATEFDKSKSHPAALTTKKYGVGKWELFKACLSREYLLIKRHSFVYTFKLSQLSVAAFFAMTVFLQTEMHRDSVIDGGIYMGALFYGLVVIMFNGMPELSMAVSRLPVFYKERDNLFFPSWAYALPAWLLKILMSFVEVGVWVFLTYYVIGFDPYVGRFFRQYLVLVLVKQMASALYRFVAALGRESTVALTLGSGTNATLLAMSGFVLSKDNIKKWWLWGFWMSPTMYGQNAMVNNEFLGKRWRHILPNSTEPLGIEVLRSRGFFTQSYWYWIGVGALIGYTLLFNFGYILALMYLSPPGKHRAVLSEEPQSNEQNGGSKKGTNVLRHIKYSLSQHSNKGRKGKRVSGSTSSHTLPASGMVLPFQPHSITFDEVTYAVDMPQEMRDQGVVKDKLVLLKGVSGAFRPGVLTALMGVTGAGKTTLMDVLAGRKTGGYVGGNIKISGYRKKQETFARISGYCEQNDIHSPHVTVYESLLYSSWLRLSPDINVETRKMFIEEVMELVELKPLRHVLVGFPGVTGLSTEQRKRLTIAVELVANPSIIFMDEPTSGLDARAAAIVMRIVRNTVDTGRTVVCTIHQPSMDIFESFDEGIQGVSEIKAGYNPATWVLEVTNSSKEMELGIDFAEVFKNSELCRRNKELVKELSTPAPGSKDLYFPSQYSTSFFMQCMACLWKQHRSYWRNTRYTALSFIYSTTLAVLLGSMFWNLGSKIEKQQDLLNALGSMYVAVLLIGIKNAYSVQPVVAAERIVLIEIPYVLVQAVVYSLIVYAMIGFEWTVAKFFWFLFFMYFNFLCFTYYGMMSMAVTPNQHISSIVSTGFYSAWNIFSGVGIDLPTIEVRFENSNIEAESHVGTRALPTFTNFMIHIVEVCADTIVGNAMLRGISGGQRKHVTTGEMLAIPCSCTIKPDGFSIIPIYFSSWEGNDSSFNTWVVYTGLPCCYEWLCPIKRQYKKWWLWGFWISPMMYGQNAMVNNEFLGMRWRYVLPNSKQPLGVEVLKSRGFFTQSYWYWIAVGALIGYTLLFNFGYILALKYLSPPGKHRAEMRNRGVVEDKLALLKGVSGAFRPGVLTALMGVTGAGKTTLMDVLAGRKTGGYIGGNITISGYPKKQETFARISGYCEQNDIHSPHVTVYESLLYSAWLRLSPEINADTRKMFIEEVMELVELKALRNALVGLPGINGLSTEQRKRLTIAVELVANPSIIFMDEPTSGLDARAAAIVMRTVRNTVDTGRTVVCTIHQPSIDIFESFDELLLMKQGGQEIYVGPLGHHSSHLINYFEGIQGVNKIKDGYNPATWMLEVSTSAKEMELGIDFAEVYKNSELYRRNKALIKELSTPAPGSKDLYFPSQYSTSFLTQCMACLWKQHWSYWRNPLYTAIRFLYSTAVAAVLGSMFWDLGSKIDKQQDLFNAMGSMYAAVLLIGIKNANAVQPVVAVERTVLIELPYVLVQAVVYGIIIYAMIGFEWTVTKVFWYLFFMYFTFLTFTYYGMMSVAVTPNQHISSIVSSAFYAVWNLFSGFIVPRPRIPVWWRWYSWANPVAWSLYGLVASQYGDIKQSMESSDGRTTVEGFVRSYFGFKHDFLGVVAAVIVAFPVVFALVFAISVKMFNFQRR
ncbi:Pleiotropic drug resistance protein 1 [Glycine soja]